MRFFNENTNPNTLPASGSVSGVNEEKKERIWSSIVCLLIKYYLQ